MARADLRKTETGEWRTAIGRAIDRVKGQRSLKEFAGLVLREERQVGRWITGEERPQFDALFAVESLRQPLVIALAELAGDGVEIETTVRVRRKTA